MVPDVEPVVLAQHGLTRASAGRSRGALHQRLVVVVRLRGRRAAVALVHVHHGSGSSGSSSGGAPLQSLALPPPQHRLDGQDDFARQARLFDCHLVRLFVVRAQLVVLGPQRRRMRAVVGGGWRETGKR